MHLSRTNQILVALLLMVTAAIVTVGVLMIVNDIQPPPPTPIAIAPTLQPQTISPPSPSPTTRPTQTNPPSTARPSATHTPQPPTVTASHTPPAPTVTSLPPTPTIPDAVDGCPPPEGWILHEVQAGETLFAYQLGAGNEVSVDEILAANCIGDRWIYEGQLLYLPTGAAENAPPSEVRPTALPVDPNAPPPPAGLTRNPQCPCEITIPQGYRLEQIAELIDSLPVGFRGADFLSAARQGAALAGGRVFFEGAPGGASLEGYMLPGTYTITNEMDASAFIGMVLDAFGNATGDQLWADARARGTTPYGAVTLASIVNRESRSANQQVLIASVFWNRLNSGRGLGATVTTQYALGRAGNWWPSAAGQVSTLDSPYNTNIYAGLPPSPIASPSLDALRSTIYPADTKYLFFTANCRGAGNAYAETYEQHLANVRCE